jgi:hypothetical protein
MLGTLYVLYIRQSVGGLPAYLHSSLNVSVSGMKASNATYIYIYI